MGVKPAIFSAACQTPTSFRFSGTRFFFRILIRSSNIAKDKKDQSFLFLFGSVAVNMFSIGYHWIDGTCILEKRKVYIYQYITIFEE
jgi:hypothetical protein